MSAQQTSEAPLESAAAETRLMPLDALVGLDSAIIRGFLALSAARRDQIIAAYREQHGDAAATWLQRATPLWSQDRLGVSRVVLARLFALLPQQMDQPERLELAKSIWHVARAPSKAILSVPVGYRNHGVLSELVHEHFMAVLPSAVELPEALQLSVPWLQDPAMRAQHDVLSLLLLAERDQLLRLADEQIEVLFAHPLEGMEIRSTLNIVGHQLIIRTSAEAAEPNLQLQRETVATLQAAFDARAPRSALVGSCIGAAVAIAGWLIYLSVT